MTPIGDTGHLDEAVRPSLRLPDERRIAMIDRDRWIGYGRAQDAISELERILRSERRQRPDNLLIVGACAGTGLTSRQQLVLDQPDRRNLADAQLLRCLVQDQLAAF